MTHPELDVDLDQFEDFDSDDLSDNYSDENDDYLAGMWGSYGFRGSSNVAQDILIAHGMVQSFVNAFARDGEYVVRFNDKTQTAGTDMKGRVVVITTAPILDESITAQEAGLVLTGLAVHEICHPRYGSGTFAAAAQAFRRSRTAGILSNLLDDVRIERRFVADYPGYAGVFEPLLKYISVAKEPKITDQLNLAIAAIRFEKWTPWTDPRVIAEREWWKAWSARYAREDSPRRHVEGIREALVHMLALAAKLKAEAPPVAADENEGTADSQEDADDQAPVGSQDAPDGQEDEEEAEDGDDAPEAQASPEAPESEEPEDDAFNQDMSPQSDMDDEIFGDLSEDEGLPKQERVADEEGDDQDPEKTDEESDYELSDAEDDDDSDEEDLDTAPFDGLSEDDLGAQSDELDQESGDDDLATCPSGEEVEEAAREDGVTQTDIERFKEEADQVIKDAVELQDGVDVATHYRGLTRAGFSSRVRRNGPASRFIRDALMRARSGHTSTSRYQKRGSLDNHGLTRVAMQDFRVFSRRHAPGPEKLLVWIMIDCSGSMQAASADAATVATAIADAAQHVRTTRMAVWGWSDSFRRSDYMPGVCRVWQTGQPTTDIAKIADLPQKGTPDSAVLNWAWQAILREAHNGERPVILFASDGGGYGDLQMKVAEARDHGVDVYSVAIGEDVNREYQQQVYGEGNFVEWKGSILATARPLAGLVARMVAERR